MMRNLCIMLILSCLGCSTNHTYDAIERARVFALKQHPELSDQSIHDIKFTEPVVANNLIYSRGGGSSKQDVTQTVISWKLPDEDGKTLMVVGFGRRDLWNWRPNRTILKHFRAYSSEPEKKPSAPSVKPAEPKPETTQDKP